MLLTDVLLGISLAMDAFVVSLAIGLKQHSHLARWWYLLVPLTFGVFQAVMPWLGWQIMAAVTTGWIERLDHWIAFGLLLGIGLNMLRQALQSTADTEVVKQISLNTLFSLAVATSIDALAVGFTLPTVSIHPVQTILVIGVTTALVCLVGLVGTAYIPKKIARPAEVAASLILIGLGCKILWAGLIQ